MIAQIFKLIEIPCASVERLYPSQIQIKALLVFSSPAGPLILIPDCTVSSKPAKCLIKLRQLSVYQNPMFFPSLSGCETPMAAMIIK